MGTGDDVTQDEDDTGPGKRCSWCDGTGVKKPFPGPCGWCDGTGIQKPSFLGHGGANEHRTCGPIRAWCYDDSEWCYANEPCTCCAEVIPSADTHSVDEMYQLLDTAQSLLDSFARRKDDFDAGLCWCAMRRTSPTQDHFPGCLDIRNHQAETERQLVSLASRDSARTDSYACRRCGWNGTDWKPQTQGTGASHLCPKCGAPVSADNPSNDEGGNG